jgi:hypothetical protein
VVVRNFVLESGSPYTTIVNNGDGTVTMTVQPNTNKESGRDIKINVQTSDSELYGSWEFTQSKADWEITDADYLQFTYGWTEDDGLDLDTFTFIKFDNESQVYGDSVKGVGYSGHYKVLSTAEEYEDCVVAWAGDNTGTGGEYTLINFKKLHDEFRKDAKIYIMGNWYKLKKNGDCNIILTGYRGGTPELISAYEGFRIVGGTEIPGGSSVENICYAKGRGNHGYSFEEYADCYCLLCVMYYNYSENKVYLYANGPEFEDSEFYCLGYYTSWVDRVEIIDEAGGRTVVTDIDQRVQANNSYTYAFTGATRITVNFGMDDLIYGNHEKVLHHSINYHINAPSISMWPDGDTNYTIETLQTEEKRFSAVISFTNEGAFDMCSSQCRTLRFTVSANSDDAGGDVDSFYLDLQQYKES